MASYMCILKVAFHLFHSQKMSKKKKSYSQYCYSIVIQNKQTGYIHRKKMKERKKFHCIKTLKKCVNLRSHETLTVIRNLHINYI